MLVSSRVIYYLRRFVSSFIAVAAHIIIAAIVILILLVLFVIILILKIKDFQTSEPEPTEQDLILSESRPVSVVLKPEQKPLTKPQDGPQNTAARINRYHLHYVDSDPKPAWLNDSFNDPIIRSNNTRKPPSTIQTEYQRLLHPSHKYYINDKVYSNDKDLAQVIADEGN